MSTVRRLTLLSLTLLLVTSLFPTYHHSLGVLADAQGMPTANPTDRDRGIELLSLRKFKDASKIFRKAVNQNKTDPEGWYYLGLALVKQEKETKNAAKAFETALKLRPEFAAARVGLSFALLLGNKLPEAMREARAALNIEPDLPDAHYVIGAVHLRSGAPDLAVTEAEAAIRLNEQLPAAHLLKSQSLVSIYGEKVSFQNTRPPSSELTPEERVQRRNRLKQDTVLLIQAAESLETYLKLNPPESSVGVWQEQLATLRVFASSGQEVPKDSDGIFSALDITTKARVTAKPEPQYTEAARQAGVTGTVVLRCVFAADGTVRHILVLKGLPNGLTERALEAARLIKFIPATIGGRPVSMFIQLEYNFNLH